MQNVPTTVYPKVSGLSRYWNQQQ